MKRRLKLGLLIAPLVPALVAAIIAASIKNMEFQGLLFGVLIYAFFTYLLTLLFGIPAYLVMSRLGYLSANHVITAGAVLGFICGILLPLIFGVEWIRVLDIAWLVVAVIFSIFGAITSWTFWFIALRDRPSTNLVQIGELPVLTILLGSIMVFWRNKIAFSKELVLPTLLLVVIWAIDVIYTRKLSGTVRDIFDLGDWLVTLFYIVGLAIFAVTCHRLVLIQSGMGQIRISLKKRELLFILWSIGVYFIYSVLIAFLLTLFTNLPGIDSYIIKGKNNFYYISLICTIPAIYIFARLCLVFPATAIDRKTSLQWSWQTTQNNGWRIVLIVGLYPWIISMLIWLISRHEATIIERTLTAFIYYIGMAVEIFALSLTYKELVSKQGKETLGA